MGNVFWLINFELVIFWQKSIYEEEKQGNRQTKFSDKNVIEITGS